MASSDGQGTAARGRPGRIHVVGAGISGLACAVTLAAAGRPVSLYEAARQAGGRCRSYHDGKLGRRIDNGNHILLSANDAALDYVTEIGARDTLIGPEPARFPFVDLASGERWTLQPSGGAVPWWVLHADRRIPGTRIASYLAGLKLAFARDGDRVGDLLDPADPLWSRFWEPLTAAALNTDPREASAKLLWLVLKETFAKGEARCRPLIARDGLAGSLVDPALTRLAEAGAEVAFGVRLRALDFGDGRVTGLDFGDRRIDVGGSDRVVLALPPAVARDLMPDLTVPEESRAIVNAHILLPEAPEMPEDLPFLGVVGGRFDWVFLRGDVASLTVSAADDLAGLDAGEVARQLWHDTAAALNLDPALDPPVRIVKEKRATFAQTPEALTRRAAPRTPQANLFLAGDWTDTGFPATIESAVRSGRRAAELALAEGS